MTREPRPTPGKADLLRGAHVSIRANVSPYLLPPAAALGNLLLAAVLSHVWGVYAHATAWQMAYRTAIVAACGALVTWVTWRVGRARRPELRLASMLMSAVASIFLFVFTFRGFTGDTVTMYLLVMLCASVLLAVTKLLKGDGGDTRPSVFGDLPERVEELKRIGQTSRPKITDGRVVTRVEMEPGEAFASISTPAVRTAIASAHDIPVSAVRMIPDRRTPRKGTMELSPVDALENPPLWPGLSAPGRSIAEALRIAVYQHGTPVPLYLPGDPAAGRNAIGVLLLLGQPGSGKTELQIAVAAEARSRRDARVTYIDGRKGMQLPPALRDNLHTVIASAAAGERHLSAIVASVPGRAAQIGAHGHAEWTRDCRDCPPFEVVIVDEASKFVESEDDLVELAESIRSVGIFMVLGIQRATGDRLPTSVRTAVGGVICMGVKTTVEGARVLSESTILAGADPAWGNSKPGAFYAELPGVAQDDWSVPARTYRPARAEILAELVAHLDAVEPDRTPTVPVTARPAGPAAADADDNRDDPDLPAPALDPDCLPDEDPNRPIEIPGPRLDLVVEPESDRRYSPTQIRALFRVAIIAARDKGITEVKPSSFAPLIGEVGEAGLKPPTITKILREFCEPGDGQLLRRRAEKGLYEVLPAMADAST